MKADHPLERATPAIRLRRKRRGERLAHFHLASEEERVDLIGAMKWPSTFSRRLTQFLLERIDQQPGAVLHAWQLHGFKVLFGRSLEDVIQERYEEQLDVLVGLDIEDWVRVGRKVADMFVYFHEKPAARRTCEAFMSAWLNAEGPWQALELSGHPIALAMAHHPRLRRDTLMGGLDPYRVGENPEGERRAL